MPPNVPVELSEAYTETQLTCGVPCSRLPRIWGDNLPQLSLTYVNKVQNISSMTILAHIHIHSVYNESCQIILLADLMNTTEAHYKEYILLLNINDEINGWGVTNKSHGTL
jgi:hypothetical protein